MKKITLVFALAFAVVALSPMAPANAYKVSDAAYRACYKKVLPHRGYGAVFLVAVDMCARGLPW